MIERAEPHRPAPPPDPARGLTLLLIGPPASGKGTQARLLAETGWQHLAVGRLVRHEIRRGTALGRQLAVASESGRMSSDELVLPLVAEALAATDPGASLVVDGAPARMSQVGALEAMLADHGRRPDLVVVLDVPPAELRHRVAERRSCPLCERTFGASEARCPADGAPLTRRKEDRPRPFERRLRTYESELAPVVERYEQTTTVARVDGSAPVEAVAHALHAALTRRSAVDASARGATGRRASTATSLISDV